jgi:excisionase family DNA binding protein
MEKLYTVKEVANILRITEGTVRNWIRLGDIQAIKISGILIRIPEEELERLLNTSTKKRC